MERVISYIDGFNLYYGMKQENWSRYYWLNPWKFSEKFLSSIQFLKEVKYFTARVSPPNWDKDKPKRQAAYLDAVATLNNVEIIYGHYLKKNVHCPNCKQVFSVPEEKMTDVNIATHLLRDAFENRFDTAFLVSGDSDLTGPIKSIREVFPEKKVCVIFPPKRHSVALKKLAHDSRPTWEKTLSASQFPDTVKTSSGFFLQRPPTWI